MKIIGISGSHRDGGNSEEILKYVLKIFEKHGIETNLISLRNLKIKPCAECWMCLERGFCILDDDFGYLCSEITDSSGIIISTPVFFNGVSGLTKIFMDRTWSIRGRLKNKVGGAIVVGRRYGHEAALANLIAFFLKHEMILGDRGLVCYAYHREDLKEDKLCYLEAKRFARRILELLELRKI